MCVYVRYLCMYVCMYVLFGSCSNCRVPQWIHSWHLSLHSGQDCSTACLCVKAVTNLEYSYCHGSSQYDIAAVLSRSSTVTLCHWAVGSGGFEGTQCPHLQGPAVQLVFLDCWTLKVKTLSPTKHQEPLMK
jgi:hypothetical protein